MQAGVPLLAVCRGHQELNVVLGGSLHQKVHEVAGYHSHKENPADPLDVQYGPSHPVNLVAGGLLHRLAGAESVMVNSLHSQGVARLAEGRDGRGGCGRWSDRSLYRRQRQRIHAVRAVAPGMAGHAG